MVAKEWGLLSRSRRVTNKKKKKTRNPMDKSVDAT